MRLRLSRPRRQLSRPASGSGETADLLQGESFRLLVALCVGTRPCPARRGEASDRADGLRRGRIRRSSASRSFRPSRSRPARRRSAPSQLRRFSSSDTRAAGPVPLENGRMTSAPVEENPRLNRLWSADHGSDTRRMRPARLAHRLRPAGGRLISSSPCEEPCGVSALSIRSAFQTPRRFAAARKPLLSQIVGQTKRSAARNLRCARASAASRFWTSETESVSVLRNKTHSAPGNQVDESCGGFISSARDSRSASVGVRTGGTRQS
jgi:hypothetical protein